jgi:hypothetical protein
MQNLPPIGLACSIIGNLKQAIINLCFNFKVKHLYITTTNITKNLYFDEYCFLLHKTSVYVLFCIYILALLIIL